jgi:tetratricopeptide (TPR) repeat protein
MRRLVPLGPIGGRRSAAMILVLLLGPGPSAPAQDDRAQPPAASSPSGGIAVGAVVVPKAPGELVSGDRDGRPVLIRAGTQLRVERAEGAYLLVSGADGDRRGWAGVDQVVPLDRALEHFDRAISRDAKDVEAYRARGRLRAARGELAAALADLDEAIRRDPEEASTYASRGDTRSDKGDLDGAIADYYRALRLEPKVADVYARRGQAWMKKHEPRQAIDDYTSAIELDPGNSAYHLLRGAAWSRRGEHDPAMEDFGQAVRLAPNDPWTYIARGMEWEKDLKPDRAIADYQAAIGLDPRIIPAYEGRGRIWMKRAEYEKVVANFAELIRVLPDEPIGHRALAWVLATCDRAPVRDSRRAVTEATAACELTHWEDVDCLESMAAACADAGDFVAAVKWQSRALKLFGASLGRAERRMLAKKRQDADLSHRLFLYKKNRPYREEADQGVR